MRCKRLKLSLLFLSTLFYSSASFCQSPVIAKKGILDLGTWNWQTNGIVNLDGEWEFYWNTLYDPSKSNSLPTGQPDYIDVPEFWNAKIPTTGIFASGFGYATYKLTIICPPGEQPLSLKFLTIASAYKLFVNEKQLLEIGKVGTSQATSVADFRPAIVPVQPINNKLNIVIQVSNFTYRTGGLWDYIKLGPSGQVQSLQIKNIGIDFFIAGSFFLIAIFYLVIFFYYTKRTATLYFSIFCLLLAIRPLVTGELAIQYITDWNWVFIKRVEFISLYLTVPVLSLFSYKLFPDEFLTKILRIILIVSTPFVLLAIFTSPHIFRYGLKPFQIFLLLTALYGQYVYIRAVKNNRPGSIYFLTGFIVLFVAIINDILYNNLIIQTGNLIYFGLFILVISQAIALSRQFFWAYSKRGILNKKLEAINVELNQKNIDINEANKELKLLNSELDILVSRTSHDLRSPITSVVALIHIIKDEKDASKRNTYLDMQRRTLHRLNFLITDILDFSRNKRSHLKFEQVDFSELLNSALQDHRFADNSSHIERIAEVNQDGIFITDKTRINMILYNLISNALKYHDASKSNPYLKVSINTTHENAEIKVTDNGSGIDKEHLKNIFTMFYQADDSSTGTGLGLYIVNEAVEKLQGKIIVDSKLGEGTTFTVLIPNKNN
jgi:signal transduction histidine kinase